MSDRLVTLFKQLIQNEVLRQRFEDLLVNVTLSPIGSSTIVSYDAQLPDITIEESDTDYTISVSPGSFGGISWANGTVQIEKLDVTQEFVLVGHDIVSLIPLDVANNVRGVILAYIYVPAHAEGFMFGLDKDSVKLQIVRGFGAWGILALRKYADWAQISTLDAGILSGELHLDEGLVITNADGSVRLTPLGLEVYGAWDTSTALDMSEPKLLAKLVGGGLYFYDADGNILSSYRADGATIAGWVIEPLRLYSGNIELSALGEIKTTNYVAGVQGWSISGDGSAEFNDIVARGHIEANSGQIGGWNISATQLSSGNIIIDSNGEIRSGDYTSGVSGWKISGNGTAEFNTAVFRGDLSSATGTIGGWEITDTSLRSGTDIELDAANKKIKIDNGQVVLGKDVLPNKSGLRIDANNYFYYDKSLGIGVFKAGTDTNYIMFDGTDVQITGKVSATTGAIAGWDVTADELVSPNNGIHLKSVDNRIEIQNAGTVKLAFGYLGGISGHDASEFGIWVGAPNALYIEAAPDEEVIQHISGDWIVNNDADIILKNGFGQEILRIGTQGSDLGLFIKDGPSGDLFVKYTQQYVTFYDISTNTETVKINADGSGFLAKGNISWDTSGNLTINATIEASIASLAGWDITDTAIQKIGPYGDGIIISSIGYIQSANYGGGNGWRLAEDGTAELNNVFIRGHVEASSGRVGDWDIVSGRLVSGAVSLDAVAKQMQIQSGNTIIRLGYDVAPGQHGFYIDEYNYFIWDSNVNRGKFRVGTGAEYLKFDGTNLTLSGTVQAKSGVIGGWTITDTSISSGGIVLDALTGTIYAQDFQFKEGSVVIGDLGGSYLSWDGVTLHVLGNLSVTAGDNVVRFADSQLELYDINSMFYTEDLGKLQYYGVVYEWRDPGINQTREVVKSSLYRFDGIYYIGGPLDHRDLIWELHNEYYDSKGSLEDGGYIKAIVNREYGTSTDGAELPGAPPHPSIQYNYTMLTLHTRTDRTKLATRSITVRPSKIIEEWSCILDGYTANGYISFEPIADNSSKGIFEFTNAPIKVLISTPTLDYPNGTIFVHKGYLYYKDAYGQWRKVTGETVAAF